MNSTTGIRSLPTHVSRKQIGPTLSGRPCSLASTFQGPFGRPRMIFCVFQSHSVGSGSAMAAAVFGDLAAQELGLERDVGGTAVEDVADRSEDQEYAAVEQGGPPGAGRQSEGVAAGGEELPKVVPLGLGDVPATSDARDMCDAGVHRAH